MTFALTMNTSNSSRHRKGDSVPPQRAKIKQTVANERSPPDKDFTFFPDLPPSDLLGFT